ncbi:unnamed protein product [Caenorhabditis auriculariae]|uniref:Uncharacterized protein n=1 Tax=Caenorhabditis auriculariae TaxID=2777116 RepID=A0A8S1GRD6_9PELO|nr:unnamed protein product [Caenorhabditis auriculariae]
MRFLCILAVVGAVAVFAKDAPGLKKPLGKKPFVVPTREPRNKETSSQAPVKGNSDPTLTDSAENQADAGNKPAEHDYLTDPPEKVESSSETLDKSDGLSPNDFVHKPSDDLTESSEYHYKDYKGSDPTLTDEEVKRFITSGSLALEGDRRDRLERQRFGEHLREVFGRKEPSPVGESGLYLMLRDALAANKNVVSSKGWALIGGLCRQFGERLKKYDPKTSKLLELLRLVDVAMRPTRRLVGWAPYCPNMVKQFIRWYYQRTNIISQRCHSGTYWTTVVDRNPRRRLTLRLYHDSAEIFFILL